MRLKMRIERKKCKKMIGTGEYDTTKCNIQISITFASCSPTKILSRVEFSFCIIKFILIFECHIIGYEI